ncbi:GNAT family N-acetyltransferase [Streptomyces sp. NPDC051940]|uniref:GNAT family N-acetyltransferase n=1 Tax=Streptomyces sp. NPDC051940 TaxID=3155675 RepID=UPI00342F61B4
MAPPPASLPTLRTAAEDDLPALTALAAAALVHDADAPDVLRLLWDQDGGHPGLRLVADSGGDLLGTALGHLRPATGERPATGFLDLVAVHPDAQSRGIGRALLTRLEQELTAAGATRLLVRGRPPAYAWPGVDIRYTRAVCLLASSGYTRLPEGLNMHVDLATAPLDTEADVERLAAAGVTVRRMAADDAGLGLLDWIARFGGSWAGEAERALAHRTPRGHVAVREGDGGAPEYVGFACHGVNRRSWFGPMGTEAAERGLGIGTVLLRRCLADQRAAGLAEAEIGWTDPIHFYARGVDATLGRVFWPYEKQL